MIQESSKDPYHAMKIRIENFGESDLRRFANSISEVVRVSNLVMSHAVIPSTMQYTLL